MKGLRYITVLTLIAGLWCCDKTPEPGDLQPVARFRILPATGNTTTVFRFDADSVTGQGNRNNPVMVRWDWESDGVWDQMYSTGGKFTHRFYKPGSYRILMEASTIAGKRDSMSLTVEVPRGYSPPRAAFSMSPDSANITHEFTFDAGLSKDDEDSLDQLEFRWDFNGDRTWDTEFSHNPVIRTRYSDDADYPVRLEVRDPQQMTSIKTDTLIVTRLNELIVPVANHDCWPCTVEDTLRSDASGSYYQDKPDVRLLYSWDLFNDNIWEVTLDESPFFKNRIGLEGKNAIKLRVTDENGLYMEIIDSVEIYPQNSPPVARLVVGNPIGNTGTRYYLHVRGSNDRDDSYLDLKVTWDIDNDGKPESEYDGLYEIFLTFPVPGSYPVTATITDPKNKSGMDTDTIRVIAGSHETGLLEDKRGEFPPNYYGTVKIGNRWWMQSNLRYMPNNGKGDDWHGGYYNNDSGLKEKYGALYPHVATYSGKPAACPNGWHVATLADWQQLMADLGMDAGIYQLLIGGSSELHLVLSGQKDYHSTSPATKDRFSGLGQVANYWTSTTTPSGQAYGWYIDPARGQNKQVVVGRNYWFPIRCIRNE